MKQITVGQLRKLLQKLSTADIPDNAPVVVATGEHSYRPVSGAEVTSALAEGHGSFGEDYGEDLTPEKEFGTRVPALLIT